MVIDLTSQIILMAGEHHARQGMTPGAKVGQHLPEAMHPDAWAAVEGPWTAALQGSNSSLDWASLDGTADYELRFSVLRDGHGLAIGAVMIALDITDRWEAHRRLERRARQQTALADLGTMAQQGSSIADLMANAAGFVDATLDADVAAVLPYAVTGGLEVRAVSGDASLVPPDPAPPVDPMLIMEHMRVATGPLVVPDLRASALHAPVLQAEGMVSLIVAPIGAPADRYGLLGACSRATDAFSAEDVAFLQGMANALAAAVERGWPPAERPLTVGVDLSPRQFETGDLTRDVRDALTRTGLDPGRLDLELTEAALTDIEPRIREQMAELRDLGVEVGLRDFGSGYASLTHLRRLPLNFIKLDPALVQGLATHEDDDHVVAAVIGLAAGFGLRSIAVGVQTQVQRDRLADLGCDDAQGPLFGGPYPAEDIPRLR